MNDVYVNRKTMTGSIESSIGQLIHTVSFIVCFADALLKRLSSSVFYFSLSLFALSYRLALLDMVSHAVQLDIC